MGCSWHTTVCAGGCISPPERPTRDPDRLSFTHAVEVLDTACYEFAIVAREELPRLDLPPAG